MTSSLRRSVRAKILALVLGTTLIALLVNAAALLYYDVHDYRRTKLAELHTQAELLGRAGALSAMQARTDVEAAALYGADGKLSSSYRREPDAAIPSSAEPAGSRISGDRVSLFHPIVDNADTIGTVYLRARYGWRDRMPALLGILALAMIGALALALLVGAWLQRALTGPILEGGDDSRRAGKSTEDEIVALRLADRRKDEFLATLAHELRNPLAPIRNALYLMQTSPNDAEVNANARAMIERQLHQLMRLVDDLLDVSRVSTGKLALRRERVELRSVAQNAIEAVEPMLHARGHVLEAQLPPAGVYVNADPTRLAQVFIHLLQNAGKFTDRGGRIDFRVGVQAGELFAHVRDNGIGVAPEMREVIFDMFSQADRSLERSTMGLGVGLSLSRRLVELHGGTIEVKSEGIGRGTEFTVRIPMLHTDIGRERLSGATALARTSARHRILLADDNRDFAVSLAALLRGMGNEVRVEHDGAAALAAAEDFRPDLAFLDIGLPKLNGFDLARKLRGLNPSGILVAVTGWGQEADRKLAREAGFDDYIVKPIEIDKLQSLLN
jgi:two-component system, sensor histidine kinase